MPIFKWYKNYSVNINELDEHHMKLFDIFNRPYDKCLGMSGWMATSAYAATSSVPKKEGRIEAGPLFSYAYGALQLKVIS